MVRCRPSGDWRRGTSSLMVSRRSGPPLGELAEDAQRIEESLDVIGREQPRAEGEDSARAGERARAGPQAPVVVAGQADGQPDEGAQCGESVHLGPGHGEPRRPPGGAARVGQVPPVAGGRPGGVVPLAERGLDLTQHQDEEHEADQLRPQLQPRPEHGQGEDGGQEHRRARWLARADAPQDAIAGQQDAEQRGDEQERQDVPGSGARGEVAAGGVAGQRHHHLEEPLVIDPWVAGRREGVGVLAGDALAREDVAAGAVVQEEVGVRVGVVGQQQTDGQDHQPGGQAEPAAQGRKPLRGWRNRFHGATLASALSDR